MAISAKAAMLALLPILAACGEPGSQEPSSNATAPANEQVAAKPAAARPLPRFRLSGPADPESIAVAMDVAEHALSDTAATPAQSFRILKGDRHVATLVSGHGKPMDGNYQGCFTALVQDGKAALVSTIGSGEWEAETCTATTSVAILYSGSPVLIGVIADAASPNAEVHEPVVLNWEPDTGALSIDAQRTRKASLAGATTIATLRQAIAN